MTFRVIKGGGVFAISTPWRQHHTRNGNAKQIYREREHAESSALLISAETGSDITAYSCDHCGNWHIGNTRRYLSIWRRELEELEYELGTRVCAHIKQESLHPYGAIRQRWKTAVRRAMR